MGRRFSQNYLPTLGADFSLYAMDYSNQHIKVTLWDLSGQPQFSHVHPQYYLGSHGAIVLYDLNSENPEDELINWIDTYLDNVGRFVGPVLIIQNKIDLIAEQYEMQMSDKHEKMTKNIGIYYQDKLEIYSARTSAKTGENVKTGIENFIRKVTDKIEEKKINPAQSKKQGSDDYTLGAYIITFENLIGPVIVFKSPNSVHRNFRQEEEISAVNLSAGLNLEQLVDQQFETGIFYWKDPASIFYYITFVIENPEARGGYDWYVIGVNISKELKNLLSDELHLIQGHLVNKMNRFSEFLERFDGDVSQEPDLIKIQQSVEYTKVLSSILNDLRSEINKLLVGKL